MKQNSYQNLIQQTFNFPQEGFDINDNELMFNDIPLMDIIKQYGTPLKISYLPKISQQIQKAKKLFNVAMAKADYKGQYYYCYCTKSSHFSFVIDEVLKNCLIHVSKNFFSFVFLKAILMKQCIRTFNKHVLSRKENIYPHIFTY